MKTNHIKLIAIIIFVALVGLFITLMKTPGTKAAARFDEPAAIYKAKCAACHLPNASKFYDAAKSDEEHVKAILEGRKGAKPPYMPGFKEKGMTEDDAKALAAYMKTLKPAN